MNFLPACKVKSFRIPSIKGLHYSPAEPQHVIILPFLLSLSSHIFLQLPVIGNIDENCGGLFREQTVNCELLTNQAADTDLSSLAICSALMCFLAFLKCECKQRGIHLSTLVSLTCFYLVQQQVTCMKINLSGKKKVIDTKISAFSIHSAFIILTPPKQKPVRPHTEMHSGPSSKQSYRGLEENHMYSQRTKQYC